MYMYRYRHTYTELGLCTLPIGNAKLSMPEPPVNHHGDGQFTIWTLW